MNITQRDKRKGYKKEMGANFKITLFTFNVFVGAEAPNSKVLEIATPTIAKKRIIETQKRNRRLCWKYYEGEKVGENVDNYLRNL